MASWARRATRVASRRRGRAQRVGRAAASSRAPALASSALGARPPPFVGDATCRAPAVAPGRLYRRRRAGLRRGARPGLDASIASYIARAARRFVDDASTRGTGAPPSRRVTRSTPRLTARFGNLKTGTRGKLRSATRPSRPSRPRPTARPGLATAGPSLLPRGWSHDCVRSWTPRRRRGWTTRSLGGRGSRAGPARRWRIGSAHRHTSTRSS